MLWEILFGEGMGLDSSTSPGKFPFQIPSSFMTPQRGRLSVFCVKPASEMGGHLSGVIWLVDVLELECKPGRF